MRRLLLLAVLFAAATLRAETPSGLPPAKVEAVETLLRAEVGRLGIPGLTAVVATGGAIRWEGAYGHADIENQVPARPLTVYRLASISKTMTAVAVLQLVEQKKLDLSAPIQKYVPAFPPKTFPVTAQLLLSHQGGIRGYEGEEWISTRHYPSVSAALDIIKEDPLAYEPGTRFLYSTHGYTLLGAAVEGASGESFLEYLARHVFEPAQMETARSDDVFAIIPNRAQGYERKDGTLRNSSLTDTSSKIPGGGLCGTAEDVARFGIALTEGALLSRPSVNAMLAPQHTRDRTASGHGLGLFVARYRGLREAWHTGAQQRVSNVLYLRPDQRLVIVLMSNLEGQAPALVDVARKLADLVQR